MPTPHASTEALESDACYLAMKTHDARFDGSFFTAVTSTGIYCRPVCRVKLPRRENCRFFRHAAQAEAEGFRPCLRCRPELAPRAASWSTEDASRILALQAARLIDEPDAWSEDGPGAAQIAARLGVSDRHLRRIFEAQFGVSPLQYLQTRRLLAAKQLIADTRLPMTQVALASGFASVRRFNAAFLEHYGLNPSALRRAGGAEGGQGKAIEVRLGFRPPYDVNAMLGFFARRALRGVELATTADGKEPAKGSTPAFVHLARTLSVQQGGQAHAGWLQLRFDMAREQMLLSVSDSLAAVLPIVISRARAMLDLDAEPMAINAALHEAFPHGDGLRVPGTVDGFELAVRAVLGQQVTVAAARTLGSRLVEAFGEPIATPIEGLDRLFPTPAALAGASGDALGKLGIVRQRQAALQAIAREVAGGRLALHAGADVPSTIAALQELPGIGAWTAQYIAMRALRWPDAFPAGDVALQKALGVSTERAASQASQAWRPWRSYAVLRAWHAPTPATAAAPPAAAPSFNNLTTAGASA
ncbi:DNA-3-methyladenine glycosylase II [Variovorax beijingensis]|uniref:DNA-3-methyladenine glycosylase II n=2 Tax=Variovorax TaxID=34072 RepID=A0AAE3XYB7_VARPD|nr:MULTISPECIES: Ada metal-binding domain-containing protein [Variovorax]MBD9664930.1 helix-turn-helix domain-containing protein [Variovorax sp. VRV01]MDP9963603.1 AraC family transcriptional regulator of adaptative response / DNA-3-methyladenine glycosylase II [Variovorax paradoxus]MDR6426165.1 AraC family transcriptional regulator of adaptative response / DNA-3-methyladenine glycosylase II [Variovorax paradoxus]MDR6451581.1 AraC family transcriptional regulator of adaptative response / DNA-3-